MFYTVVNILFPILNRLRICMPNKRHMEKTFIGFWCTHHTKTSLRQLAKLEKTTVSECLSKIVATKLKSKNKVLVGLIGSATTQAKVSVDVASKFLLVGICCVQSVTILPFPVEFPFIC